MTARKGKIARQQDEAILALLTQRSIDEAARVVGISPRTLYRWLKEPAFDKAYRQARRLAFEQQISRLQQASSAAVTTLLKLAVEGNTPPAVRVRAAFCVLSLATKAIEVGDLQYRVAELEQARESMTES